MVVTVKYVFGLARGADGRDTLRLELPPGATVFEALRKLGLSALELHAAVNGESAGDGTVLRDGDEMILIPSIQGGRRGRGGVAMRRAAAMTGVLLGVGLAGSVGPVAAQTRVVVPIVIQVPRPAPARSATPSSSVRISTQTRSPTPGLTTTRVTVRDTTGAGRALGTSPTAPPLRTAPLGTSSVLVTTRTQSVHPGTTTTRVTVRDTTGAGRALGTSPAAPTLSTAPVGTPSVLVTVDQSPGLPGTGALDRTRVRVEDGSSSARVLGGPAPTSSARTAGTGGQTVTITSDGPIDAPIVILGP